MKIRQVLLLVLFLGNSVLLNAQDTLRSFIVPEAGIIGFFGSQEGTSYIRQYVSASEQYGDYSYESVNSHLTMSYAGVKYQRFVIRRVGISVGLRYVNISSGIQKNNYSSGGSDYFYFLLNQSGTTTNYLKVRSINFSSHGIGIPVEVTYSALLVRGFSIYVKGGYQYSYSLDNSYRVRFENSGMNYHTEEVIQRFGTPDKANHMVYAGAGLRFGKRDRLSGFMEFSFPSLFLNRGVSTVYSSEVGGGIQVGFQIPIH